MIKKSLNRIKQRDKKRSRFKMRVDDSARKLALVKRRRLDAGDYIKPNPERLVKFLETPKKKKRLGERRKLRRVDNKGLPAKKEVERRIEPSFATKVKVMAAPYIEEVRQAAQQPSEEDPLKKMVKEGRLHQADLDAYLKA